MIAPDAVRYQTVVYTRSAKWQLAACLVAVPVGAILGYFSAPPGERLWALALIVLAATLFTILTWRSVWLEPTDGVVVTRWCGRYESRHRLGPTSRVHLRAHFAPPGPFLFLRVREAGSRRTGSVIALLRTTDDQWAGIDADRIRLLADTLQWHCPDAAPDAITTLHAHADHLEAGLPVDDSPLGRMLCGGRP